MKSVYEDPEFADHWDRVGHDSTGYKRWVLDPIMLRALGPVRGKTVLELGCGNGITAPKLFARGARQVICLDISEANLVHARRRCGKRNALFIAQDARRPWKVAAATVDRIYSRMVLNEIDRIGPVLQHAARVLKPNGRIVIGVLHPALALCDHVMQKSGRTARNAHHVESSGPYFRRAQYTFLIASERHRPFRVPYHHHTVEDYVTAFLGAGLRLVGLMEPAIGAAALLRQPKLREAMDRPRSLVLVGERMRGK